MNNTTYFFKGNGVRGIWFILMADENCYFLLTIK